uniref:uncharacterized protein LOC122588325 n=1 Tax=Erigeron canadensis TaxID=72917 RepID=UPI001CB9341F|nr:uncharacterized protein LOC122588325 [Erigeron canadensis]
MSLGIRVPVFLLAILLLAMCAQNSEAHVTFENGLKSMVYLSPKITLHPGSVSNKFYYDIEFPKGHIGIKSFDAELVDEAGNSVPLHETYLHHWVAIRYYQRIGIKDIKYNVNLGFRQSDHIIARNGGVCKYSLPQVFGLGAETRKTSTYVPDPYGIEVGNPLEVPVGFEERWMFNIHAIDTRGAVDAMGCTECRCNLYNVTEDEYSRPLKPNYVGGIFCCYDETQCKLKNHVESVQRNLYLKYTVKWVDWSDSVLPVKIFIFDVTDTWQKTGTHDCLVEYDVEQSTAEVTNNDYTSTRRSSVSFPTGGDVVYGVAHLHSGGIGSALYGDDGRIICSSKPIYGQGNSAGDEAGYIVGMSTCYPKLGSMKIAKGEILTLESNYSCEKSHTGVMGLFYILVAESSLNLSDPVQIHEESKVPIFFWGVAVFGLAMFAAVVVAYQRRQSEDGYISINQGHIYLNLHLITMCDTCLLEHNQGSKMSHGTQGFVCLLAFVLLAICAQSSRARVTIEKGVKSMVYLSPKITLHPGSVSNKTYYDIEFPKGHIAIKSFNAEIVDEAGNPVSLKETYVHHWTAIRYYQRKGVKNLIMAGNSGLCKQGRSQIFGMGSETRKTSTYVPDPYGIEVGNPLTVPAGYTEKWMFNIHAMDTLGAVDPIGCTECRCNLYNVTVDKDGQPLRPNYVGGLFCCYDGTQCKVKNGLKSTNRNVYFKYTVKWVDWSDSIIPVKIFILDIMDIWQNTGIHNCLFEYDIKQSTTGAGTNDSISTRRASVGFPIAGDVVYSFAQQYIGGVGSTLYGEDGRVLCSSKPIYGQGNSVGDEAGYIVGMSTCYPKPGSVKIAKGENLTFDSNYSSQKSHTGVLGLFYLLVA